MDRDKAKRWALISAICWTAAFGLITYDGISSGRLFGTTVEVMISAFCVVLMLVLALRGWRRYLSLRGQ